MRKIDCAHSRSVKIFEKSAKNSKKIMFKVKNMGKNMYFLIFKGQKKVSMLREYAQSMFRTKLPLNMSFFKFRKKLKQLKRNVKSFFYGH